MRSRPDIREKTTRAAEFLANIFHNDDYSTVNRENTKMEVFNQTKYIFNIYFVLKVL